MLRLNADGRKTTTIDCPRWRPIWSGPGKHHRHTGQYRGSTRCKGPATTTIPIVFGIGIDPVGVELVSTFNRPGGNVTGIVSMNTQLGPKRLGLMRELLPQAARFGLLVNPGNPTNADILVRDLQAVAIDKHIEVVRATTVREIDAAFAILSQQRTDALLVNPDAFFSTRRVQLATLATRHAIPVIYVDRIFPEAGGLMSYGSNILDRERQVGVYTGRISQR